MEEFARPNIYQLLRHFRHDLLNDLQLLLGHIQLGRSSEVIYRDVQKVVDQIQTVGSLFACQDDELATLLWQWQRYASLHDIEWRVEVNPLPEPIDEKTRASLQQVGQNILSELSHLESNQRFFYVKVSAASPRFLLKASPLLDDSSTVRLARDLGWLVERADTDWRYWSVH